MRLLATLTSLVAQTVKRLPTIQETRVQSLGREDLLEKEMATHSSILAWKIPWTEKPGSLQSMGSQSRTRLSNFTATHFSTLAWKIPWTEEPDRLQSIELQRVGQDRATSLSLFIFMHWRRKWQPTPVCLPGESQGRGAWWAAIYGVTQSRTRLKQLSKQPTNQPTKPVHCNY